MSFDFAISLGLTMQCKGMEWSWLLHRNCIMYSVFTVYEDRYIQKMKLAFVLSKGFGRVCYLSHSNDNSLGNLRFETTGQVIPKAESRRGCPGAFALVWFDLPRIWGLQGTTDH